MKKSFEKWRERQGQATLADAYEAGILRERKRLRKKVLKDTDENCTCDLCNFKKEFIRRLDERIQ